MILTLISVIIGLSPVVLVKLHPSTQQKLFSLSFLLVFVPMVSALMGTLSFSQVTDFNLFSASTFFIGWFLVIYVIDRALIHLSGSSYAKALRIGIGILFGLLHGLLIDAYIFENDINFVLDQKRLNEVKSIEKENTGATVKNSGDIKEIQNKISTKEEYLLSRRQDIFLEIDGQAASGLRDCGPVCRQKIKIFQQDSIQMYSEIENLRDQISELKKMNSVSDSISQAKIAAIPNYKKEVGLKNRLDVAHDILISNGSFSTRMIAIVIFLLSVVFEQLVLIFKDYLGVKEYKEVETRLSTNNTTFNKTIDENDLTISLHKEAYRLVKIANEINAEAAVDSMNSTTENIKRKNAKFQSEFDHFDNELNDVLRNDSHFKDEREAGIKSAVEEFVRL